MSSPVTLPESAFLERIGIDLNNREHYRVYELMNAEVRDAWSRLRNDRNALLPHLQRDASIEPPYHAPQIGEQAFLAEVVRIYDNASPQTRPFYDISRTNAPTLQRPEHNWVIRRLLWNCFRPPRQPQPQRIETAFRSAGQLYMHQGGSGSPSPAVSGPDESSAARRRFWDPVRSADDYVLRYGVLLVNGDPMT